MEQMRSSGGVQGAEEAPYRTRYLQFNQDSSTPVYFEDITGFLSITFRVFN